MATAEQLQEPWSRTRDAEHPVRWSPADGDTPAYLTLRGAAERLSGYRTDSVDDIAALLLQGVPLRTPFAFYAIDEPRPVRDMTPAEVDAAAPPDAYAGDPLWDRYLDGDR